jgi:putative ABC transport system substrate-binding protein
MDRRTFIGSVAGGLVALPLRSEVSSNNIWQIGILDPGIPEQFRAFREGMSDLGYVEGQNISYEIRSAQGRPDEIPHLAAEIVNLRPDVIVTAATFPIRETMRHTTSIAIVAVAGDAVGSGIASSLAKPTGNVTGLSFLSTEVSAKRIELLKETLPGLHNVAMFNDPRTVDAPAKETVIVAQRLGLRLQRIDVRSGEEFGQAFSVAKRDGAEAIDVLSSAFFNANRGRLVGLAAEARLPAIYESRDYVDAGGLMSYGHNFYAIFRRAATYADKILKGAKPADLPWEQPTKFELVINLKTAKALGLTIPPPVVLRADEVIH